MTYKHLIKQDCWRVLEETFDEEEILLVPAYKGKENIVSKNNGEVWCLSKAIFANGEEHLASSMCRGDSSDGPLLLSVWNGTEDITLKVPPAPDSVLENEGPVIFCKKFNKKANEIFPLKFEVIPVFEVKPQKRRILISENGMLG